MAVEIKRGPKRQRAYDAGFKAGKEGIPHHKNPFLRLSQKMHGVECGDWSSGWQDGQKANKDGE